MCRVPPPRLLVIATLLVSCPACAQPLDGNPRLGRQIAVTVCSSCHRVDSMRPSTTPAAHSFEDIANLPSTTALSLNVFLRSNHEKMPNFIVSPDESNNVIAYILSLKRR